MGNTPIPRDPFNLGDDDGVNVVVGERLGDQTPPEGHYFIPPFASSLGDKAVWFLHKIGFELDPWQEWVLRNMLNMDEKGLWAASEALLLVPRQNGKTRIIEARELVGLYIIGEKLCIHTAVLFSSARESYYRIKACIQKFKPLADITHFRSGNDNMSIEINDPDHRNFGCRLIYMARGTAVARGFSADVIVLDEAYALDDNVIAAIDYATSARRNAFIIYASSTGMEDSETLMQIRERGLQHDPDMLFIEWCAVSLDLDDEENYYKSNPALGIRISIERVRKERKRHSDRTFGRERLGLWADNTFRAVIPHAHWKTLCHCNGLVHEEHQNGSGMYEQIVTPVVVSIDSDPMGVRTTVALAGYTAENKVQVEIWKDGPGVGWALDTVSDLYHAEKNPAPVAVAVQVGGSASQLIPELQAQGCEVIPFSIRDIQDACKYFYDRAMDSTLSHLGDKSLSSALSGATQVFGSKAGGSKEEPEYRTWYWGRKDTTIDITGLCACTNAAWGLNKWFSEQEAKKEHWADKPRGGGIW